MLNQVSEKKAEEIKATRKEKSALDFSCLLCNDMRVPFDVQRKTFYISLDMEEETWESLDFMSGQPEYEILFFEDIIRYDKKEIISEGKKFPVLVYNDREYASYYVTFSGLPLINLTTDVGIWQENIEGKATFYDTDFTRHGIQQSEYNGHIRGNTSRMFPKKGYKINLITDQSGVTELNKMSLFGMREDDDWILHALYNDDTKIRDRLSMEIWERFGADAVSEKGYYGPKMTYVEVFADNRYCGLYGLVEPVDAKQMDLQELDYSYKRKNPGGLIYQYLTFSEEKNPYREVEGFEIKEGMMSENAWQPMADLCAWLTLTDEEFLEQQWELVDIDSALRLWLFIQMITGHDHTAKNVYYVARYDDELKYDYKFYFAPWDMDLTWGNVSVGEINTVYTAFEHETVEHRVYWDVGDRLIETDHEGAKEYVQELYKELRGTVLTDQSIKRVIYELDSEIRNSGAFERDSVRWPEGVHASDCEQLVSYAKERLAFLDKALYDLEYYEN